MDDLFCASVLSANGTCLQVGGPSLPWYLLVHLGELPGAVFFLRESGGFATRLPNCICHIAVSQQSASRQC